VGEQADGDEAGEFVGRTGIYARLDEISEPTVAAPPPSELQAAIDESADRDASGSNPLVDVFADLGLDPGVPAEPLTGDLSIDLEGEVDRAAWSDEPVASLEEQLFDEEAARALEADTEAAIDAALAEPVSSVGGAGTRAVEDDQIVGDTTIVASRPMARGADPPIDPSLFKLPESGPPLAVNEDTGALADLEREIEHHLGLSVGESVPGRSARLHLYAGIAAHRAGDNER